MRVLNEGEHCTPELVKAVFDVDVHASINPLTGKPFFMPFRGVEKYDAHRAGYCNFPHLTAGGMRGISRDWCPIYCTTNGVAGISSF